MNQQMQQQKSRTPWKAIALGCLGALALTCVAGIGAAYFVGGKVKSFITGTVVARVPVAGNAPFAIASVPQRGETLSVWLDFNITQNAGPVTGTITLSANGANLASHAVVLQGRGRGCFNPTVGESRSMCVNFAEVGHTLRGRVFLFDVPQRAAGTSFAIQGSFLAPPGTTIERGELQVRE